MFWVFYEESQDPWLYEASARFVGVLVPFPDGFREVLDDWGIVDCIWNTRLNNIQCLLAYARSGGIDWGRVSPRVGICEGCSRGTTRRWAIVALCRGGI